MTRSFVLVALQLFKNRFLFRFKRLREPRYLLSALIGMAYFGYVMLRAAGRGRHSPSVVLRAMSSDIAAIFVLILMLLAWIIPAMASLEFSEAEMQFLFPAPLKRPQLLYYKLIRSQPSLLLGCVIGTLFGLPNGHFVGLWVTYTVLGTYMTFVAVSRARLSQAGVPVWAQSATGLGLLVGAVAIVSHFAHKPLHHESPFDHPVVQSILFIPKIFAAALFAREPLDLAIRLAIVAAAGALFVLAAGRMRVPFEELVMTASQRAANWRESRRTRASGTSITLRRMPAPFALRENATAEVAILWKNLTAAMRIALPWVALLVIGFAAIVVQGLFTRHDEVKMTMVFVSFAFCGFFPLAGAGIFKQDFRLDVTRIDLLKTFPIRGERLVAAEIAGPLLIICALEIYFLGGAMLLTFRSDFHAEVAPQFAVIALLFALPLCAMQLVLRNAVPIFLPGWSMRSKEDQRGFYSFGTRILGLIANLVALALTLAPAVAASAIGFLIAERLAHGSAPIHAAATMPGVALLVAEVWAAVKILGSQYDRLDASRDVEPGTL
ncbi:MAG TPA: putative ABC exporter domain-containing protein [Thermoanaerobaculia bacterium]|nr:putative ABC exporter domain-containing protein [Thermoanaerobaculia bacterium]